MKYRIRNWEKWQSYRKDRGQPPWIKLHRELLRNPEWVSLTDAQRGQLVSLWLLAADQNGVIPASPTLLKKLCYMDNEPDLQVFVALGFIEPDATVAPERRQDDRTEVEVEVDSTSSSLRSEDDASAVVENSDEPKLEDLWGAVPDLTGDKSTREYLDDIRKEHDEWWDRTAGVIRKQWWKGREIPNWTMGQEYNIWCQLVGHGFNAEELHGAISVAPKHLNFRGPATLKVFRSREKGYPLINQCVGEWRKQQTRNPQSIGSLLKKSMGDAA